MLKIRGLVVAVIAAVLMMSGLPSPANADVACTKKDKVYGVCEVEVPVPGKGGGGGGGPVGPRVCKWGDRVVDCENAYGTWIHSARAWCRLASPQPPKTDRAWEGNTTGSVYFCQRFELSATFHQWLPSATPVDPGELAQRALARLELGAVRIGMNPIPTQRNPKVMAVVGQKIWLWADSPDATTWGPKEVATTVDGHSVSLSAKVEKVVWDMGNKMTVTCKTPGTKWEKWRLNIDPNPASPDCGYLYEKQGKYTVTAVSHWAVRWSALDQTGVIRFTLSDSVGLTVGEIQVLNVPTKP